MLAANDHIAPEVAFLQGMDAPQLRVLIAHASGLLAHLTSGMEARSALRKIVSTLVTDSEAQTCMWQKEPGLEATKLATSVAAQYGLTLEQVRGKEIGRRYSVPRQAVMYALDREGIYSQAAIGRFLNRDHTTVIHGVRAHKKRAGL